MLNHASLLARDFRAEPYWWNIAAPESLSPVTLERDYDVAIVGSGITGLRCAIELARAGSKVIVFDREDAGSGAARRNAGFLGRTLKKFYIDLERSRGAEYARRVYGELNTALETTIEFIGKEHIDCFVDRRGRFIAATSTGHLVRLVAEFERIKATFGLGYQVVPEEKVHEEMGTSIYCGGVVVPDLGSLHPGLYHKGLLELAMSAGAIVSTKTNVLSIARKGSARFSVDTSLGRINATNVVVTTNGYTPRYMRWYARRLIPFTGYMAATEELPDRLLAELIPNRRTIVDSNFNIDFFRTAPDAPRLLFGGSTGSPLSDTNAIADRMHDLLIRVFPQLRSVRLSAVWSGKCAATFDMMPHMGGRDGLWYGMGYNFAGVPMGSYFGMQIARGILANLSVDSVFSEAPFKTYPFYDGRPWFLPLAMRVFEWQDRRAARIYS